MVVVAVIVVVIVVVMMMTIVNVAVIQLFLGCVSNTAHLDVE